MQFITLNFKICKKGKKKQVTRESPKTSDSVMPICVHTK